MAERLIDVLTGGLADLAKKEQAFTEEQRDILEDLGYEQRGFWYAKDGRMVSKIELTEALQENKSQNPSKDQYPLQFWMFTYDAKNKARLPVWDTFPVVFVTDFTGGGFAGINIHYIDKQARKTLLQEIMNILDDDGDPGEAMALISEVGSNYKGYKKYLNSYVRTAKIQIPRAMWEEAFDSPGNFIYR
jgi:hypothetical protein